MQAPSQSLPAPTTSAMDDFWRLATLPIGLCWSTWLHLFWPCHLASGCAPAPVDHQLVVPEPIEAEGEHALFA